MNKRPEYIKMCEKAEEIQVNHEPQAGDYYQAGDGLTIVILPEEHHIKDFCSYECLYLIGIEDEVWLPLQHQLQEMMELNIQVLLEKFTLFCGDCWDTLDGSEWGLGEEYFEYSIEQLWLAFVMKEKYGKIWNGNDWVKEVRV